MRVSLPKLEREMKQGIWTKIPWFLALATAAGYILLFLVLAGFRLFYPFELEWIEGGVIDEIRWLMDGNPLYSEPSIAYIPFIYNPLFFLLSAVLMKAIGIGFAAPRLLSILSTTGCFLLLFALVSRDSKRPTYGLIAAGIYAASFHYAGAWMDTAKSDSLFLFLILSAAFVSRRYRSHGGIWIAGILYVLAYFTKQSAIFIILTMASASLIASRGRTWVQWLFASIAGVGIFWGLDRVSSGWYSFYTFDIISHHHTIEDFWFFWPSLIKHMWPALSLSLVYVVTALAGLLRSSSTEESGAYWYNLGLASGLLLASWSSMLHRWSYHNDLMPLCAGLSLLAGLGCGQVVKLVNRVSWRPLLRIGLAALLLLQFAALYYNPVRLLPTGKDRQAAEQLVSFLSDLSGEVFVFNHGFLNYLAGKNSYLYSIAYADAVGLGANPPRTEDNRWRREQVHQVFEEALTEQVFDWVIVDKPETSWLPYYLYVSDLIDAPGVLYPVTGARSRPESLMARNPVAQGGAVPLSDASSGLLLSEGWSVAEDWGRWAMGHRSTVLAALEQGCAYELVIEAFPFCPPAFEEQIMEIGWNDAQLATHTWSSCEQQRITLALPAGMVAEGVNTLWFQFEKATSPAQVTSSSDQRPLAVGFVSLTFLQREQ